MDRYTQLSPEMQELWDEDMKRVKEELEKLDYKQLFKISSKNSLLYFGPK